MDILRNLAEVMGEGGMNSSDMVFVLGGGARSRRRGRSSGGWRGWRRVGQKVHQGLNHADQNSQHQENDRHSQKGNLYRLNEGWHDLLPQRCGDCLEGFDSGMPGAGVARPVQG